MHNKQYVVIGLGRFGISLAKTLYSLGNEVLAIDADEELVQSISDSVTHSIQLDATDESALRSVGIKNFDVAVITVGADIQSSVMITLLVKELGVKHIIAKANNELHAKVLYKIGADRVVMPEKDMGVRVAHNLVSSSVLDFIELSAEYNIAEIAIPKDWEGRTLKELSLRSNYGINVVAIKKGENINISPTADDIMEENDIMIAIGGSEELSKLESMFK